MAFMRKHRKGSKTDADIEGNAYAVLEELANFHSGWLTKKSFVKSKQLWCTLTGKWLSFWKNTAEHEDAKGGQSSDALDMCLAHQVARSTNAKTPFGIDITLHKEKITLVAPDMKECEGWIHKLQLAMQYTKRAESLRQSCIERASMSGSEPSPCLKDQGPLYEELSDLPLSSASHTPTSEEKSIASVQATTPVPPLPSARKLLTPTSPTSPATTPAKRAPAGPLYEEIDLSHVASSPDNSAPSQNDQPTVEQKLLKGKENTSLSRPAANHTTPSLRKTHLMAALPTLNEGDDDVMTETVVKSDDGPEVVKVRMRSTVSTSGEEKGLPSVDDLYTAIVKKNKLDTAREDRISTIWNSMEETKPDRLICKLEQESPAIKELRRLLDQPSLAPDAQLADNNTEYSQLERGPHMQAFYELLYT
ncbi:uncharacterized protein [Watersipora subatra]|uniref:uncharacterized protein n=1 Tax=Watersipora subatra TaxID=2589382 RepID=UPI00355BB292